MRVKSRLLNCKATFRLLTTPEMDQRHASAMASVKRIFDEERSAQAERHKLAITSSAAKVETLAAENKKLSVMVQTQGTRLSAELAECRQEAVDLQSQLLRKEKSHAEEVAALEEKVQSSAMTVVDIGDQLQTATVRLREAKDGNEALAAEIRNLKKLFFRESARLTPRKKRKTGEPPQETAA